MQFERGDNEDNIQEVYLYLDKDSYSVYAGFHFLLFCNKIYESPL